MPATTQADAVQRGDIVSARVFDAPRAVVFGAFADAGVLPRWWGPKGFSNAFEAFELRPGGSWRFVMRGPDGAEYRCVKEFVEVVPNERVVLRHVDAVHGFRMAMAFADESGGTRVTWTIRFDSADEGAKARGFIEAANEENFDRLAAELAGARDAGEGESFAKGGHA